jgi:hypothetical protein
MSYNWAKGCIAYFLNDPKSLNNESMKDLKRFDFADKQAIEIVKNSPLLQNPNNQMLFFYKLDDVYDPGTGGAGSKFIGKFKNIIDAYKETITQGYNYFYYYPDGNTYVRNNVVRGSCWTESVSSRGGILNFKKSFTNVTRCPSKVPVYAINPWVLYLICSRIWYANQANNAYLELVEGFKNNNELRNVVNNLLILMILIIIILVIYFILKKK